MRSVRLPEPNRDGIRSASLWTLLGVIALTVLVFAAAILLMLGMLRERLREGIVVQEGKVLQPAAAAGKAKAHPEAESAQERSIAVLNATDIKDGQVFAMRM